MASNAARYNEGCEDDELESFTVSFCLLENEGSWKGTNLNVNVSLKEEIQELADDGTVIDYFKGSNFTLKWSPASKQLHLPAVFMDEIQLQDDLTVPQSNYKLAIKYKPFAEGGFGRIFRGITNEGLRVVVKKWKTQQIGPKYLCAAVAGAYFEAFMCRTFTHPNILGLISIIREVNQPPWLVLEFMEHGSLWDVLQKGDSGLLRTAEAKYAVTQDIVSGMAYLHSRRCIHRDLTTRNVLIEGNSGAARAKITDFGLATFLDGSKASLTMIPRGRENDTRRLAFSLFYTAPEVLPVYVQVVPAIHPLDFIQGDEWPHLSSERSLSSQLEDQHQQDATQTQALQKDEGFVSLEPEGAYHFKSDVWSFGVVAHQLWTDAVYEPFCNTKYFHLSVEDVKEMLSDYSFEQIYHSSSVGIQDRIRAAVNKAFGGNPRASSSFTEIKKSLMRETQTEGFREDRDMESVENGLHEIVDRILAKPASSELELARIKPRLHDEITQLCKRESKRAKGRKKSPADFVLVKQSSIESILRKVFHGNPKKRPAFSEIKKMLNRLTAQQLKIN